MNAHVYVDFDGTLMQHDTTDVLLERFALPEWHAVEAEWAAGRIGSRECMARQIELLRATPAELEEAVACLEMDPGFPSFLASCRDLGLGVTIVSDGLDLVIRSTLTRHRLDVAFFANHLVHDGYDRWHLEFPNAHPTCAAGSGHCKCARTQDYPDALAIVIGDGRSDFCIAGLADLVLAKSKLTEECRSSGLPHLPFRDFREVPRLLLRWLDGGQFETDQKPAQKPAQELTRKLAQKPARNAAPMPLEA
jgi:2-hydroxy-3-keto-5-methylthiopentenyl-1-phosphate phosphatase